MILQTGLVRPPVGATTLVADCMIAIRVVILLQEYRHHPAPW